MKNIGIAKIITEQLSLFWISIIYGMILGVWYEFFRTLRKVFAHRNRMVHIEDIIFCITAALGLFTLFQIYNQGIVRFYCLVGIECGILFYFFVCSEWTGKLFCFFINISSNIIKKVGKIALFPVKLIIKNTGKILKNMIRTIKIIRKHK